MEKRNKYLKAGRPLKYGEPTLRHPGFYFPKSKKGEINKHIKSILKSWELPKKEKS